MGKQTTEREKEKTARRKRDVLLIAGLLFFALFLMYRNLRNRPDEPEKTAVVSLSGQEVLRCSLSDGQVSFYDENYVTLGADGSFTVYADGVPEKLNPREDAENESAAGNYNVFSVSDGAVRCKAADCPDGICMDTGSIRRETETIVCLPHKLIATVLSSKN